MTEEEEADRLEKAIIVVGASDFRPGAREYALPPADLHDADRLITTAMKKVTARSLPAGVTWGALMHPLNYIPGMIANECELVGRAARKKLIAFGLLDRGYEGILLQVRYSRIKPDGSCLTSVVKVGSRPFPGMKYRIDPRYLEWFPLTKSGMLNVGHDACNAVNVNLVTRQIMLDQWSVAFASGDSPAVRVPTSAGGVAGMYRMRDKPDGMSRRKALLHWVREHHRSLGDGRTVNVREHYRGAEEFDWFDLRCRVYPPDQSFGELVEADAETVA